MNSSCLPPRFLLKVILCLLAAACGSFSSTYAQTSNLKLQPERPNKEYYSLRGSTFVLNCTILIGNLQAFNLTWQHNGKQLLSNIQQIDSTTIQLKLSSTNKNNNGIYWCGPKSSKTSQGVNMSLTIADPPSPPPNLSWSVVGAMDLDREYRIFWSASSYTGGLPVNYSVKLCVNDSFAAINGACKWSSNPECQPELVLSTNKDFFCVLNSAEDFIFPCEKVCNYTIFVVATNDVGSALSWRYLPFIPISSATPFPPLNFNVVTTGNDKELRVSWTARRSWKHTGTDQEYTILYHAENRMENETKVKKKKTEFILLTQLEAFVVYYVYLTVRFVSNEGVRSAPSEVQGPRIVKTPAGDPDTPSKVLKDTSATFLDNPALRNVTVEWKFADNPSWRGTPGRYIVSCNHHLLSLGTLPNCEYHVDATSNVTVLTRLNSTVRYSVYIKMCNKEKKCGSPSEPYIIKELTDSTTPQKNGAELSRKKIALITALVVAGCIAVVCIIYLNRKCRKELRDVFYVIVPLKERVGIPAPVEGGYYYADPSPTHAYDELTPNENQA